MLNPKKIKELSEKSKAEKWEYPKIANALKELGIDYYKVEIIQQTIIYYGKRSSFSESFPKNFQPPTISEKLDISFLKQTIRKNQLEKTSYYQSFLKEIAMAGVINYCADLQKQEITYFGKNNSEKHIEKIPNYKEEIL